MVRSRPPGFGQLDALVAVGVDLTAVLADLGPGGAQQFGHAFAGDAGHQHGLHPGDRLKFCGLGLTRFRIQGVDLQFDLRDGETIWTESSYKYMPDALITQLEDGGFESMAQWIDRDAGFALTLARPRATVSG